MPPSVVPAQRSVLFPKNRVEVVAQAPTAVPCDVWSAVTSHDGRLVAAGAGWWTQPGEFVVWELATRKQQLQFAEARGVAAVAFSPDDTLLASASWTRPRLSARASVGQGDRPFHHPWYPGSPSPPTAPRLSAARTIAPCGFGMWTKAPKKDAWASDFASCPWKASSTAREERLLSCQPSSRVRCGTL